METAGGKVPFPQWIRVIDSNGLASALAVSSDQSSGTDNRLSFQLTSFPRHESSLLLELHGADPPMPNRINHLADFRIKNPAQVELGAARKALRKTAEAMDERFALLELNTGLCATSIMAQTPGSDQWKELVFRMGTNEPRRLSTNFDALGDWSIQSIEMQDAAGNLIQERNPKGRIVPWGKGQYMSRLDDGIVLVPGSIWPDSVWNIRAEFRRNATLTLSETYQWKATVPVPTRDEMISLNQTGRTDGCVIVLSSIESELQGPSLLRVNFDRRTPTHELKVLRIQDQRSAPINHRFWWRNEKERRIEMQPYPESARLEIVFAVISSVLVEVQSKPAILRTNVTVEDYFPPAAIR